MSKRVVVTLETFNDSNELVEQLVVKGRSYIASVIASDIGCDNFSELSDFNPKTLKEDEEFLVLHANGEANTHEMAELLHQTNEVITTSNPSVKRVIDSGNFNWNSKNEKSFKSTNTIM